MSQSINFAFTVCSNNYLGQALALKISFLQYNPDFTLYIIIVDEFSEEVDYTLFDPAVVIKISDIDDIDLEDLISRYYIIELNTSIKPSVFKHILKENPEAELIYYLDPDLFFYDSLSELNNRLRTKTAILTPHIVTPIPRDGKLPDENIFLNYGIYNLGFFGINTKNSEAIRLLDWWEERTIDHGYDRSQKGYFVDQLWMIQSPLFFDGIDVIKTYNYNMAPWNLHERRIVNREKDRILLNDDTYLVFYHFSKIADNDQDVSREYNRYVLNDFPPLKELYSEYKIILKECHHLKYKDISITFPVRMNLNLDESKKQKVSSKVSLSQRLLKRLSVFINRVANKL
jgi:hypothetical protein